MFEMEDPGPALAGLVADANPGELSDAELIDRLGATERLVAWAQSRQLASIRELARRRPAEPDLHVDTHHEQRRRADGVCEYAHLEIAAALTLSHGAAQDRLDIAMALDRMPATAAALERGTLSLPKVKALVEELAHLTNAAARGEQEARLLLRAPAQTPARLRRAARRAAATIQATTAAEQEAQARAERRVSYTPLPDGLAEITAVLPAEQAQAAWVALTALAQQAPASSPEGLWRSLDQRRADVFADLAALALDRPDLPRRHGRRPEVQVLVAATTLLGLDARPGELVGYGPISAQTARHIAGDATWRRILTDPATGGLLDYGTTTYQPPQALADKVIARHRTCRFPGCGLPADRCQLDHVIEYPAGPTAETNLGPLSARCYRAKHRAGWQVQLDPTTWTYTWTSPTGHTYTVPAEPVLDPPQPPPQPPPEPDTPPEDAVPPEPEEPPF